MKIESLWQGGCWPSKICELHSSLRNPLLLFLVIKNQASITPRSHVHSQTSEIRSSNFKVKTPTHCVCDSLYLSYRTHSHLLSPFSLMRLTIVTVNSPHLRQRINFSHQVPTKVIKQYHKIKIQRNNST